MRWKLKDAKRTRRERGDGGAGRGKAAQREDGQMCLVEVNVIFWGTSMKLLCHRNQKPETGGFIPEISQEGLHYYIFPKAELEEIKPWKLNLIRGQVTCIHLMVCTSVSSDFTQELSSWLCMLWLKPFEMDFYPWVKEMVSV